MFSPALADQLNVVSGENIFSAIYMFGMVFYYNVFDFDNNVK